MDLSTVIGIVCGLLVLLIAVSFGGEMRAFLNINALMITLGGTVAATLVNYPLERFAELWRILRVALSSRDHDLPELVRLLVYLAEKARYEGLLALEDELEEAEDEFLAEGVRMVVDGMDPEAIRQILESDLSALAERHRQGQSVFETMGGLAPGFGMIGTLVGLVQMLRNLEEPESIGPGLAVALITTLYGILMANLVFLPLAGKLGVKSEEELFYKNVIIEGVLALQRGENPRIMRERLSVFLSPEDRRGPEVVRDEPPVELVEEEE